MPATHKGARAPLCWMLGVHKAFHGYSGRVPIYDWDYFRRIHVGRVRGGGVNDWAPHVKEGSRWSYRLYRLNILRLTKRGKPEKREGGG